MSAVADLLFLFGAVLYSLDHGALAAVLCSVSILVNLSACLRGRG